MSDDVQTQKFGDLYGLTLTRDLDLTINVHFGPYLSTCWTEHLQIFTQAS